MYTANSIKSKFPEGQSSKRKNLDVEARKGYGVMVYSLVINNI
jgi:hypothetical protein